MKHYRVTEILQETQSEEKRKALIKWQKTLQKKLGIEEAERKRQEILDNGTLTHDLIERYLTKEDTIINPKIEHVRPLLNLLLNSHDNLTIEKRYWNDRLKITGKIDCSFTDDKKLLNILDWTTSKNFKLRGWIEEKFIQMGAYSLLTPRRADRLNCVVILPRKYQIFEESDVEKYEEAFIKRLNQFLKTQENYVSKNETNFR